MAGSSTRERIGESMPCLVRHARTAYSAGHRLNGRPDLRIGLDAAGRAQCRLARAVIPVATTTVCVVSGFVRAQHTARLVLAGRAVPVVIDARLNELDYGDFEGRPFWEYGEWLTRYGIDARPPGGAESQRQGLRRMVAGLRDVLTLPGQPLTVAHGLLVSMLLHTRSGGSPTDLIFPEAGYLTAVSFTEADLVDLEQRLAGHYPPAPPTTAGADLATVVGNPPPGTVRRRLGAPDRTKPVRDGP